MSSECHLTFSLKIHLMIFILFRTLIHQNTAFVVTNRMRYSQPKMHDDQGSTYYSSYRSFSNDSDGLSKSISLDEEDKNLLDKFYHQFPNIKPPVDENLSIENVWKNKLLDHLTEPKRSESETSNGDGTDKVNSEWEIDMNVIHQDRNSQTSNNIDGRQAIYSPLLRILTSYDPLNENMDKLTDTPTTNKIVGVTLGVGSLGPETNMNSTLAIDAIKLHDDMLKPPPRDGKVRVRMYYHQAIHDDVRLYGNGPWKYWGHGWGMELGYEPKKPKDFFQRGYSIERAYGRDFCKDQTKCRKSDPTFFDNMLDAGKYGKIARS